MARNRLAGAIGAICCALLPGGAAAQIVTSTIVLDGSILPPGSPLQPGSAIPPEANGLEFQIKDEHGRFSADGKNRYHSFSQFDLFDPNQVAVFSSTPTPARGAPTPDRVIVRVTEPSCCGYGGSAIFGTLRSTIPNADLYFLNPFGVVMDGAKLDVQGSFYTSTADVLRFADGANFATGEAVSPAMLSSAPPSAFGFTSAAPAPILIATDQLDVPEGHTLSFVAGSIEMSGRSGGGQTVTAAGATVQLGAAGGPIDLPVDLSPVVPAALPAPPTTNAAPGAIHLHRESAIDVGSAVDPTTGEVIPAGGIVIRGGRFVLDDSRLLAANSAATDATGAIDIGVNGAIEITNGSRIESASDVSSAGGAAGDVLLSGSSVGVSDGGRVVSEARGAGRGGAIEIDADSLRVSNVRGGPEGSFISSVAGVGAGGDVEVRARNVELVSGGQVRAETAGAGDAGDLKLTRADVVHLSGIDPSSADVHPSGLTSLAQEGAAGSGGNLIVATRILEVENGAQISARTDGEGSAGDVSIAASESVAIRGGADGFTRVSATSTKDAALLGRSGNLTIEAPSVVIADGGSASVSTAGGSAAGTLAIRAANVSISGVDPTVGNPSGVFAQQISGNGDGAGGDIAIETSGDIDISDRGVVSVLTRGAGRAGNIHLAADGAIHIASDGSVAAETAGGGSGGLIELDAGQGVAIADGGRISAQSTGVGPAGDIDVDAGPRLELARASITTDARNASGGRVRLTARDAVVLQDARVTTSVSDGTGGGGNVTIDPQFVILDRSAILANADEGPGGNIRISANTFLASPESVLDASSQLGIDGTVVINSPNPELTEKLAALPQGFLNASELLADACLARTATEGSFVVHPRGMRPPPDAALAPESAEPQSCSPQEKTR